MSNGEMDLGRSLEALQALSHGSWVLDACGVTRSESPIPALVNRDAYAPTWDPTRMLLVGGLSGTAADVELALQALDFYIKTGDRLAETVSLSAIPCGNPDGLAQGTAPANGAGGIPSAGYPPVDNFFGDATDPETRYIWRRVSFLAPYLLFEVRTGARVSW